ncbi:recombinase RecT [Hoeflea sp. TYP-13]|uniref:recombinase RecT n=1 Tax=Hoeflea sp. TYP-13 TaxID=3230023 RepID=UPI0034C5BDB1
MNTIAKIEEKINPEISRNISVGTSGITFDNAGQVMEFAKMMAVSGSAVPQYLQGHPGTCLGIVDDAIRLRISPYALARKSHVINGNLGYEAQVLAAIVIRDAPLKERPNVHYEGEGQDRVCKVVGHFNDGSVRDYNSPKIKDIKPKNSPLWQNDPDQQLAYYSLRAFARRHCPDVLLGMYDREELQSFRGPDQAKDITPTAERLRAHKQTQEVGDAQEGFDPDHVSSEVENAAGEFEIEQNTIPEPDKSLPSDQEQADDDVAASEMSTSETAESEGDGIASGPSPSDNSNAEEPELASADGGSDGLTGDVLPPEEPEKGELDTRFIEACRQMLAIPISGKSSDEQFKELAELNTFWRGNLPTNNHRRFGTVCKSVMSVIHGDNTHKRVVEYLSGVIGCEPSELEAGHG